MKESTRTRWVSFWVHYSVTPSGPSSTTSTLLPSHLGLLPCPFLGPSLGPSSSVSRLRRLRSHTPPGVKGKGRKTTVWRKGTRSGFVQTSIGRVNHWQVIEDGCEGLVLGGSPTTFPGPSGNGKWLLRTRTEDPCLRHLKDTTFHGTQSRVRDGDWTSYWDLVNEEERRGVKGVKISIF